MFDKKNVKDLYELSPMQKGMLFHSLKDQEHQAHMVQGFADFSGKVDVTILEESFQDMIQKYDVLRTIFLYEKVKQPIQVVLRQRPSHIQLEDISHLDEQQQEEFLAQYRKRDRERGFDLSRDLLIRMHVVKRSEEAFQLIWNFHHILMDGWCWGQVFYDLFETYRKRMNQEKVHLGVSTPYSEYIRWLQKQDHQQGRQFWKEYLSGYEEFIQIPKQSKKEGYEFREDTFLLEAELTDQLNQLAKTNHTTLNTVIQTVWGVLLQKYNRVEDVVFGAVVSGRPAHIKHVEEIVGLFINTVPVRIRGSKNLPFEELLRHVHEESLETKNYEHISLAEIQVDTVGAGELFDHIMAFENYISSEDVLKDTLDQLGLRMNRAGSMEPTNYPMNVAITPGRGLTVQFAYNTNLYEPEFVRRMFGHLRHLIEQVVANPAKEIRYFELVTSKEQDQIMLDFNQTKHEYDLNATVVHKLMEQIEQTPNHSALWCNHQTLTYQELVDRADLVASKLIELGVGKEQIVAVEVNRSMDMFIGTLAAWKSGAAYMPIDPTYPVDRVQYMLEDSQAKVLITQSHLSVPDSYQGVVICLDQIDWSQEVEKIQPVNQPEDLAYVIYTSGSTGMPKGVAVEHRSLLNLCEFMKRQFQLTHQDRCTKFLGFGFDASVLEMWPYLFSGSTIYVIDDETYQDMNRVCEYVHNHGITMSVLPTQYAEIFMKQYPDSSDLRVLIMGGDQVQRVEATSYDVINMYGPTENTVTSTFKKVTPEDEVFTIGRPIDNHQAYILNEEGQFQPVGVPGELCVSGIGLARGYLHRADLTDEKFVPHPVLANQKMYKTGDLAVWKQDGEIEFLGRIDHQVKIRGYRIEIGEVTSQLLQLHFVQDGVVVAKNDAQGRAYLCAYVVVNQSWSAEDAKKQLSQYLPDYMIPTYLIEIEYMPMTPNGKIDTKALPEPGNQLDLIVEYEAPKNQIEDQLTKIWCELLELPTVGVTSNFFELGGHSLKAISLVSRLQKEFGVQVPLQQIFHTSTIRQMAEWLLQASQEETYTELEVVEKRDFYPVSSQQKRIYIVQGLDDTGIQYNMPAALKIMGNLDVDQLQLAFQALVDKHDALRTRFQVVDDQLVQIIEDESAVHVERVNLQDSLEQTVQKFVRPFDLAEAPLIRLGVCPITELEAMILIDMHHIVTDGFSLDLLLTDLWRAYEGKRHRVPAYQYKDYTVWQQTFTKSEKYQRQERYWLDLYQGEIPTIDVPTDFRRGSQEDVGGDSVIFRIPSEITRQLKELSKQSQSTLFTTLLTSYYVWLHKYTQQQDLIVGTPIAGRPLRELEEVVGMFVNTLALRNEILPEDTLLTTLNKVKQNLFTTYEHSDYPFEELVDQLQIHRDLHRNPLFDTLFILQNVVSEKWMPEGLLIEPVEFHANQTKFDLTWEGWEDQEGLVFSLEYKKSLYTRETAERMTKHFVYLLEQVVSNPEQKIKELKLVTPIEEKIILQEWNIPTNSPTVQQTVVDYFHKQVGRTPDQEAVVFLGQSLTYQELDQRANTLAKKLHHMGVQRGSIVAIQVKRSLDMIIAPLAVLKAGAAYMPIDPSYPLERVQYMLEDSKSQVLLTQSDLLIPETYQGNSILLDQLDEDDVFMFVDQLLPEAHDLAYIIYTSGSTGQPKGVMVEHHALVNLCQWHNQEFEVTEKDRATKFAGFGFDASVWETWPYLIAGATLVVIDEESYRDIEAVHRFFDQHQITIAFLPTQFAELFMLQDHSHLRTLLIGGDKAQRLPKTSYQVINNYGPTENTVVATSGPITYGQEVLSIGKPITNNQVYILNQDHQLQPVGVPGELCISGASLAKGYWNRPELTAEKFVDHPFESGKKMYKTGDLVRWMPDGNIEYLGRMDHQVKIRGYRIELDEINAHLLQHPAVRESLVTVNQDEQDQNFLVAYLVWDQPETTIDDIKQYLGSKVPEFMIPNTFMELQAFPITPNGKIDRRALPKIQLEHRSEYVAPSTPLEKSLVEVWKEVLQLDQISIDRSFFDIGGHSLKATLMISKIKKEWGYDVTLKDFYIRPTVAQFARYLEETSIVTQLQIQPVEKRDTYPVSSEQKRLYIIQQQHLDSVAYHIPARFKIHGKLDIQRLKEAFVKLIQRHEAFRTSFHLENGELVQRIAEEVEFQLEDGMGVMRPFDLGQAPLLRASIALVDQDTYELFLDLHHIIADGMSIGILVEELIQLYQGDSLEPLPIQYKDFAAWQQDFVQSNEYQKQEEYWLARYQEEIPTLELMADFPRGKEMDDRGATYHFQLDEDTTKKLKELSKANQSTLYMTLLASYFIYLHKCTGQEDLIVGTPVAGRSKVELKQVIGMFVNTLALRQQPKPNLTVNEFFHQVRQDVVEALSAQDYPFESLVSQLDISFEANRNPLFDTMFLLQNLEPVEMDWADLKVQPIEEDGQSSKFDMTWEVNEADGLSISIQYRTSLYTAETIQRMANHFAYLVSQIVEKPNQLISDLELVIPSEKAQILEWNQTKQAYLDHLSIPAKFEQMVKKYPEAIAIEFQGQTLTYQELNARANLVAAMLQDQEVKREQIVAVLTHRSIEMVVGVLGVLKAGAVYLPVDPTYPEDRIEYMLSDSGASIVLLNHDLEVGQERISIRLDQVDWNLTNKDQPLDLIQSNQLAYMIYTSGSTGKPKGVLLEHRGVINLAMEAKKIGFKPHMRNLQFASFSFDASVWEFFGTLLNGGTLVLAEKEEMLQGSFTDWLTKNCVESVLLPPSVLRAMPDGPLPDLKILITGGEACSLDLVERFSTGRTFINAYGPTEGTVISSWIRMEHDLDVVTIGKPLANTESYILNAYGQMQPIGIPGELCISGHGLAREYHQREELTTEKFTEVPSLPGKRIYRTGDLARYLSDGRIEYLGRIDDQVKIRGYRIELGEVKNQLLQLPGVTDVYIQVHKSEDQDARLCAYVVLDEQYSISEVKRKVSEKLPDYMIPAHFVVLESLPMTANGKVDKKQLPDPQVYTMEEIVLPTNSYEQKLVEIWKEVLSLSQVSTNRSFFEVGGQSLKAMMLIARIQKEWNVTIPIKDLFVYPTITELASYILSQDEIEEVRILPAEPKEDYPVTSAQRRMYVVQELELENTGYNIPMFMEVQGSFDVERWEQACQTLVDRHESLRTSFHVINQEIVQKIESGVRFQMEKYEGIDSCELDQVMSAFVRPFQLDHAPLFRVGIVEMGQDRTLIMMDHHHIISDGGSFPVIMSELLDLYQGKELEDITLHYKDYAVWQQGFIQTEKYKQQETYWFNQYHDEVPVLDLHTDYPRPSVQKFDGAVRSIELSTSLTEKVRDLARHTNTTLFMTLFAAYHILLSKYTGKDDLVVGTPVSGRSHTDLESMIGMFVNTLAIRSQVQSISTVEETIHEMKKVLVGAYEHADFPLEELIEKLEVPRDLSRNPLFDTMFVLQNIDTEGIYLPEAVIQPVETEHKQAKFDLTWVLMEQEDHLTLSIEYATALYKEETIDQMMGHFVNLLEQMVQDVRQPISQLEIITEQEKQIIIHEFQPTARSISADTVQTLISKQVKRNPKQLAVVDEKQSLDYQTLDIRSKRLAQELLLHQVKQDAVVAIMVPRSTDMIVGVVGSLYAGSAFLPIDLSYPMDRKLYMLEHSKSQVLVTHSGVAIPDGYQGTVILLDQLQVEESTMEFEIRSGSLTDLAYVIYTSGSTGKPKGVMIEQHSIANFIHWHNEEFEVTERDHCSKFANFSFDASVWEILPPLVVGATIYIAQEEHTQDLELFHEWMLQHQITISFLPTQFGELYMEKYNPYLRYLLVGGDKLHRLQPTAYQIVNNYGPTENTIVSTSVKLSANTDRITIGRPVTNHRLYVMNRDLQLQPVGVPGELYVAGEGVARGYIHRPDLTLERFFDHPIDQGSKLYRTGDVVRWLPEGELEFIGRTDHQVKVRGYRIELDEVNTQIALQPQVRESIVIAKQNAQNMNELVAYLVLKEMVEIERLRQQLSSILPDYMIPTYFVVLEEMPLTPNGKIDRRNLPDPVMQIISAIVPPQTEDEQLLVDIWKDILGRAEIGVTNHFFELGGDSIKAIQVVAKCKQRNRSIRVKDLFEAPTIRELAKRLEMFDSSVGNEIVIGEVPLTPIQQWVFDLAHKPSHWNQAQVIFNPDGWDETVVSSIFQKIVEHHDALRMVYHQSGNGWSQYNQPVGRDHFTVEVFDFTEEVDVEAKALTKAEELQRSLDLEKGPLARFAIFRTLQGDHLLMIVHHLVIDAVSWRIIMEDFETLFDQAKMGLPYVLPIKSSSFLQWSNGLQEYAKGQEIQSEIPYWKQIGAQFVSELPCDLHPSHTLLFQDIDSVEVYLSEEMTQMLMVDAPAAYQTEINDLLISTLILTLREWAGVQQVEVNMEGHGREEIIDGIDLTRTVGWFTTMYPTLFQVQSTKWEQLIPMVRDQLHGVPNKGIGYGILKYLAPKEVVREIVFRQPEVNFNYLGHFENGLKEHEQITASELPFGMPVDPELPWEFKLDFSGLVMNGQLEISLRFHKEMYDRETIVEILELYLKHLTACIQHCREQALAVKL